MKKYDHVKYWNVRAYTHRGYGKVLPPSMSVSEVARETDKQVEIIKRCCPNTHSKILDAGCGIGRISCELAARGYSVCGIDASVKMIGVAKHAATNVEYKVADLKELPFQDNEFNLVFELSVLLHVPDTIIESVVNEFKRVSNARILIFPSANYFKDASYMFYRSTEQYETLFEPFMLIHTELVESKWGTAKAMLFEKEKQK